MKQAAVWVAVLGFCVPQVTLAATPASQVVQDLMLHEGGTLVGQIVDSQASPLKDIAVSLRGPAGELAAGKTNANGYFAFSGLKSGVYQVATPAGSGVFRVWAANAAPPSAQRAVLMVVDSETLRGQICDPCGPCGGGICGFLGKHPLLTAGLIAAAIAIPIAVTADSGPSSP
jgi:hypothetical protein